jgi:ABC-type antimicrobial peptide transport system permease subunit
MGIPVRAGRDFTPAEAAGRILSGQVIIDELLARRLFGQATPIGRRIWMEPGWLLPGARPSVEVIGVVGSIVTSAVDIRSDHQPIVYVPAGDPLTLIAASLLIIATMLLATWLPARRVGAIDPSISLRSE